MREIEAIERELTRWQEEKRGLDAQLADPAFYASPDVAELRALARRQRDLSGLIELSEARWLAAQVELEAIGET